MLRFHPSVTNFVQSFSAHPVHALLLTGQKGSGLATLANYIASQNGTIAAVIMPQAKSTSSISVISVEQIRDLYSTAKTLLKGTNFIIIDDADAMNHVAQNALLKLLEEPNESIHFILTSHSPDALLPTIRSRTQHLAVPLISMLDSQKLLKSLGVNDETMVKRLLYVAEGLPAELMRLASDPSHFKQLSENVAKARQFIEGSAYQRLTMVQQLKLDRAASLELIQIILLLLRRSISASSETSTIMLIEKLVIASEAIRANGNTSIHFANAIT